MFSHFIDMSWNWYCESINTAEEEEEEEEEEEDEEIKWAYLPAAPPSAESWLPASLDVLTDLEGDTGVGTK